MTDPFTVHLSPISINRCWQGKRFKTKEYAYWRRDFGLVVPKRETLKGWCHVNLRFYVKNFSMIDTDNLVKPTLDGLVENGIIEDDRFVVSQFHQKMPVNEYSSERVLISIHPIILEEYLSEQQETLFVKETPPYIAVF